MAAWRHERNNGEGRMSGWENGGIISKWMGEWMLNGLMGGG